MGARRPQGKRKKEKKEKKEKREKKRKREKKEKRERRITSNYYIWSVVFFQFVNSPVALKNKIKFGPPRKSWNDAPGYSMSDYVLCSSGNIVDCIIIIQNVLCTVFDRNNSYFHIIRGSGCKVRSSAADLLPKKRLGEGVGISKGEGWHHERGRWTSNDLHDWIQLHQSWKSHLRNIVCDVSDPIRNWVTVLSTGPSKSSLLKRVVSLRAGPQGCVLYNMYSTLYVRNYSPVSTEHFLCG